MNKKIVIDGMMCMHCAGSVEKALNALDGVTAKVDLEQKLSLIHIFLCQMATILLYVYLFLL